MANVVSSFSYYPLMPRRSEPIEPCDVPPERSPDETDVWLTHWQVAEDGFDVAVGDDIAWMLVPMDRTWARHLFGGRRPIRLQLDTYAAATRDGSHSEWTRLTGQVTRIDQVSAPASAELIAAPEPLTGTGEEREVPNLRTRRATVDDIVGWILRVRR